MPTVGMGIAMKEQRSVTEKTLAIRHVIHIFLGKHKLSLHNLEKSKSVLVFSSRVLCIRI